MRGCYSGAGRLAHIEHELGSVEASGTQILTFDAPKTIDRVVVSEDQTNSAPYCKRCRRLSRSICVHALSLT